MADIKESQLTQSGNIGQLRAIDAQGNSIQCTVDQLTDKMRVATIETSGLMSAMQSKKVDGIFINYYYAASFVLDTGVNIGNDSYYMFDIKAVSAGGTFSNAAFAVVCINNSSGFMLKQSGQSSVSVQAFILNERIHLFIKSNAQFGNLYLKIVSQFGIPSYYSASEIPAGAVKIVSAD
jgi:hypothetical protein